MTRSIQYANGDTLYRTKDGFWWYYSPRIYGRSLPHASLDLCTHLKSVARRHRNWQLQRYPALETCMFEYCIEYQEDDPGRDALPTIIPGATRNDALVTARVLSRIVGRVYVVKTLGGRVVGERVFLEGHFESETGDF